jgi:peptide chain release factor
MEKQILHITSGKGPAECCLAVAFALREIIKEAASKALTIEVLERVKGIEKNTLLSVTIVVKGNNAVGFCNSWTGVLQWICESPFRKFHKRKNWFIGIQSFDKKLFSPWFEQEVVFQTMRASGPGGQHVNKVESAVRAKHLPSGITVVVSESRSQIQNKNEALKRIKMQYEAWQLKQAMMSQQELWQQHHVLERGNPAKIFEGITFKKINNGK